MKYLLPFIILCTGCAIFNHSKSPYEQLSGGWRPVEQIFAGNPFPPELYATQRLVMFDSSYTVYAESIDAGKIIMTENHMDIYGFEGPNAGKHFKALYHLQNDTLKICYDLTGVAYPDYFISDTTNFFFISTFVRDVGK
jgi:uncharacterized protein (TIGR03067 family)